MKRFKVSLHPADLADMMSGYSYEGFRTALCNKPEDYTVEALTGFEYCREVTTNRLRVALTTGKGNRHHGVRDDLIKMDRNRFRLLIAFKILPGSTIGAKKSVAERKELVDINLAKGIKLLNHFERRYGWGITKMYKTDNKGQFRTDKPTKKLDMNENVCICMTVSSKKWMKSPAVASLYLLLLRLGFSKFDKDFDTHEELMKLLATFSRSKARINDASHVSITYKKWCILLENLNRIYAGRTAENIYNSKNLTSTDADFGNEGFGEGISELCEGRSGDIITTNRFQELCVKEGIEQQSIVMDHLKKKQPKRLEKELKRLEKARMKSYENNNPK